LSVIVIVRSQLAGEVILLVLLCSRISVIPLHLPGVSRVSWVSAHVAHLCLSHMRVTHLRLPYLGLTNLILTELRIPHCLRPRVWLWRRAVRVEAASWSVATDRLPLPRTRRIVPSVWRARGRSFDPAGIGRRCISRSTERVVVPVLYHACRGALRIVRPIPCRAARLSQVERVRLLRPS
jgi:hypothetical protein